MIYLGTQQFVLNPNRLIVTLEIPIIIGKIGPIAKKLLNELVVRF